MARPNPERQIHRACGDVRAALVDALELLAVNPASTDPDAGCGRHRERAVEFPAPDAVDRRACRRLLEDPPAGLAGFAPTLRRALCFAARARHSVDEGAQHA